MGTGIADSNGNRQEGDLNDVLDVSMSEAREPRMRERMMCGGSRRSCKRAEKCRVHFKEEGLIAVERRRN